MLAERSAMAKPWQEQETPTANESEQRAAVVAAVLAPLLVAPAAGRCVTSRVVHPYCILESLVPWIAVVPFAAYEATSHDNLEDHINAQTSPT